MASNMWLPPVAGKPPSVTKLVGGLPLFTKMLRRIVFTETRVQAVVYSYQISTRWPPPTFALPSDLHNT
jgi:hypothetical protein